MWRDVLIGTYTWGDAEGIYRGRFDDETGAFETLELAIAADSPAFLAARGDMLYAVNEQREGGVSAFRRDHVELDFVNAQPSGGSLPCHLSAGSDWVAVANYGSGTVALFPTADDGGLLLMADSRQHRGKGPNSSRQETAHAHEVHALGSTLVVPDLGTDTIHRYAVESNRLREDGQANLAPGSGPRHVEMHPSLPLLYVLNELGNTVDALSWPDLGARQRVNALPGDFSAASTTAELQIARDGRWLYASNRGHDSIVSFAIDSAGRLHSPEWVPTRGEHPRYFCLDPSNNEDWLIVLNQDSDNVVVYRLTTGRPTDIVCETAAPTPVCLMFA
ncbi:MAG: lactonase family protein [Gammaproteobacteria bacterium]|nr:lactonase family protein [Gammaproteobacteria bacterium]